MLLSLVVVVAVIAIVVVVVVVYVMKNVNGTGGILRGMAYCMAWYMARHGILHAILHGMVYCTAWYIEWHGRLHGILHALHGKLHGRVNLSRLEAILGNIRLHGPSWNLLEIS